jgi:trehalose 6-phosphate synthase
MDLSRADHNGFANRTLWPLLHFRLDLVDYDRATREGYHKVNALFADKLAPRCARTTSSGSTTTT